MFSWIGTIRVVILAAAALTSAACAVREAPAGTQAPAAADIPTRRFVDDLGRSVEIPREVRRVVSLAPNLTEMAYAVGAGDKLVGVTTYCNFPEQAMSVAKVGDTMNPNLETIVALKPDLVIVSTASQIEAFAQTLAHNGISTFVTNPLDLDGVMQNLDQFGRMFGTESKASEVVSALKQRREANAARIAGRPISRVFVQISREPLFTIGRQSFLTGLLRECGASSVTAEVETAYPKLSKETARTLDFDAMILSASPDNTSPNEVFAGTRAVKGERVFAIDADILSRPGPRLVDAMEKVTMLLHP